VTTPRGDEVPALVPLTDAARAVLLAERRQLMRLPFRVGRDLREPHHQRHRWFRERRRGAAGPNDLYLPDTARPFRISRTHFLIGFDADARRYFLEDCGSSCGTKVEGERIGGDRHGGRRLLRHGEVIQPGGSRSPFVFRFVLPGEARAKDDGRAPTPSVAEWRERS
jgi:pSer/pThr/pTyr-binding forkhead associated (FHA) protein